MFVKTVKLKKPNPIAIVIILAAVLILIAVWVLDAGGKGIGDKYNLPTNAERTTFLSNLGWDVSPKETECKVIKIPSKFNTVYEVYNKLQKQQGFDLAKLKGKTVEIYTYEVYNYPESPENIVAHLIICEGKLIGGDVCCIESDGFMQGLMPKDKKGMKKSEATKSETNESADSDPAVTDTKTTEPPTTESPDSATDTPAPATESPATTTVPNNNEAGFFFTTP